MKQDSKLSTVLHALLHMAEANSPATSETLALCMSTHPERHPWQVTDGAVDSLLVADFQSMLA